MTWAQRIRREPDNEWLVYEACRAMGNELAEASHETRLTMLTATLPHATPRAIREGLAEWEAIVYRTTIF